MARRVPRDVTRLLNRYFEPFVCQSCLSRTKHASLRQRQALKAPYRNLQTDVSSQPIVPLRKQLKDEAKQRKLEGVPGVSEKVSKGEDARLKRWELTVGIEIHAELNTECKLFSSAATSLSDTPNTHVALFDLALPGTQPEFQIATLLPALRAAIALDCEIQRKSSFDRKHYFYQDQPNGYQITQYYEPFAKDGSITLYAHDGIDPADGESITIGIKQIQMEQDTAKTVLQPPDTYLLDFNRVSHPLIEIITLPQIHHPATAAALVRKVQSILKAVDANTTGMEMGGLRADVNVSVRQRHAGNGTEAGTNQSYYGITGLGQRTEIKNLNSFKAVEDAIIAERDRQINVLEAGGTIEGETRGWTLGSTETTKLRSKEGEVDYRYMPDPDLGPVIIGEDLITHLRDTLPALPDSIIDNLTNNPDHQLTLKDAKTLATLDDGDRLDYFLHVRALILATPAPDAALPSAAVSKAAANWILHDLPRPDALPAQTLAAILAPLLHGHITTRSAKRLLALVTAEPHPDLRPVAEIIAAENLAVRRVSGEEYARLAAACVAANADVAARVRKTWGGGNGARKVKGKVGWFVGVMLRVAEAEDGGGRALEPEKAEEALRAVLFGK